MEKIFLWTNPTNPTALTVILLLVFVKQVANIAVILSKQCAAVLTSLLGMLEFFTVDALHFLYFETIQLMIFVGVMTQPACIKLVTTRCLEETGSVIVLATPRPWSRAADAIFLCRRRHLLLLLLHLPPHNPQNLPPAWKPRLNEAEPV